MLCVYHDGNELCVLKSNELPKLRLIVLSPSTVKFIVNSTDELWHVCNTNILPKRITTKSMLVAIEKGLQIPPMYGGIREITNDDAVQCCLFDWCNTQLTAVNKNPIASSGAISRAADLVTKHPTWRSGLGFMLGDGISSDIIRVLSNIFDIRRFMTNGPRKLKSRLRNYFRVVTAAAIRKALVSKQAVNDSDDRAATLLRAWKLTLESSFSQSVVASIPHAFLFREAQGWESIYKESGTPDDVAYAHGLFRATVKALDFIRLMWLAGLGVLTFDPFRFFNDEEAVAFVKYRSCIS